MPGPIPVHRPAPAPTLAAALRLWDVLTFAERLQVAVRIESVQPGIHALFRSLPTRTPGGRS
ncbi:hypothetical protein HD597_012915 [Nonomuraea thailandensis]|uniref:Uncharacterized protein n=1 Tax=Nonomuraea thailandensis TaxID=1188745 RepID=A0A9X2GVD8_9ACTN|nr:hypothetical protein [Nonomuraea thailandensis]MCP2365811.1 hypothetical protein [Nonomuraea thailandensis]